MKKKFLKSAVVFALVICALTSSTLSVFAEVGDISIFETEYNNSMEYADEIYNNYTVTGSLSDIDLDYFKFTLNSQSDVTVLVISDYDTFMMGLYNSDDEIIDVANYNGYSGKYYRYDMVSTLNAGTYYLCSLDSEGYNNGYMFYIIVEPIVSNNSSFWKYDSNGWWYDYGNGHYPVNKWEQINGKWYFFDSRGYMLSDCWKQDSIGWCYLGSDGAMKTNSWIMDSVGWCYVGSNGYCVTNCWMKDSIGWCYLDSEGRMATNKWILDSVGWCYVGSDGYCVTNSWMKDSVGWCYLDGEGRMVYNKWVQDSVGWCYIGADGYFSYRR